MKAPPRLSLCMILRNNEDTIERALDSAAPLVDEIVAVIDTRSTDRTAQILRDRGAVVRMQDWLGFGEQRNESLRYARGDWALILDGDEEIHDAGDLAEMVELCREQKMHALNVAVHSLSATGSHDETSVQLRVVDRNRVRYKFPIHNQPTGYRSDRQALSTAIFRAHYRGDMMDRFRRTEPVLRGMLETAAHGSEEWKHAHYFLARTYVMTGQWDRVRYHAEQITELDPAAVGRADAWVLRVRGVLATEATPEDGVREAELVARRAKDLHPMLTDLRWWAARLELFEWARSATTDNAYVCSPCYTAPLLRGLVEAGELLGMGFDLRPAGGQAVCHA